MYPRDEAQRQRALALEDYFDEQVGPAIRAAIVTPLFRHDPDTALRVLMTGMPERAYRTLRPLIRVFPAFYRFRHRISEKRLDSDRATVAAALDRIEAERQPNGYLVGDSFTVADLTAASMFGALLQPPEIQYPLSVSLPDYLQHYRDTVAGHPAAHGSRRFTGVTAAAPRKSPGSAWRSDFASGKAGVGTTYNSARSPFHHSSRQAADDYGALGQVDIVPAQIASLADPEAVAIDQEADLSKS